ncbi:helix-turn-helix domain-containing protein [Trueperella pecoris]|uniref:helix-turn-helix domain-containing protein n=1 Tax=Trueperella pecoris TaxID=2733571 RepID=UPI001ABE7ECC|nr:helix-turn-helix domain-containing protein [Trueperella pecoris]QTG75282.1 sigma-70 family RNA polymerase sigma factor [Trueperella pecoris]
MEAGEVIQTAMNTPSPEQGLRAVVALHAGYSWQQIADILGVSRQAAHKKYAKRIDPNIPVPKRTR